MTAVELARDWARRLEDMEQVRTGAPKKTVRPAIAEKVGVSPGTLVKRLGIKP